MFLKLPKSYLPIVTKMTKASLQYIKITTHILKFTHLTIFCCNSDIKFFVVYMYVESILCCWNTIFYWNNSLCTVKFYKIFTHFFIILRFIFLHYSMHSRIFKIHKNPYHFLLTVMIEPKIYLSLNSIVLLDTHTHVLYFHEISNFNKFKVKWKWGFKWWHNQNSARLVRFQEMFNLPRFLSPTHKRNEINLI